MAMDIDPFSMLEISLQEEPDFEPHRSGHNSSGVMHQVENVVQIVQPPPPLHYLGSDVLTPQRAVLNNIQKLSATSKDEEKFRRRAYSSISLVLRKRLHCTICDAHIGAYLGLKEMDIEHPLLKVLACSKCTLKYHYLEFPLNPDGRDVRCRWCTNSAKENSPLRFCSYCPFAFCEMCIYRNLPLDELASNKNSWICFVCNINDLWPSRAVLWALRVLIDTNLALKEEKKWSTDQSTCCKNKVVKLIRGRLGSSLSRPKLQSTNGHNVATRAPIMRPMIIQSPNSLRMINPPRPIRPNLNTGYRLIRPASLPGTPDTSNSGTNANTQLYDTAWLTDKVSYISTTILNLNNNLHRLAQGIPARENKYSIKSKMISMVSLLNISATQLQKASKEMEEESKKILDKNFRVTRIPPVNNGSNPILLPAVSVSKVVVNTGRKQAQKRRMSSSYRRNKKRRTSGSCSESDDPDFQTSAVVEEETSSVRTRACFVKLERLKVDELAPKCDAEGEPQPSTSSAPDPLGTVAPSELSDSKKEPDSRKDQLKVDGDSTEKEESGAKELPGSAKCHSDGQETVSSEDRGKLNSGDEETSLEVENKENSEVGDDDSSEVGEKLQSIANIIEEKDKNITNVDEDRTVTDGGSSDVSEKNGGSAVEENNLNEEASTESTLPLNEPDKESSNRDTQDDDSNSSSSSSSSSSSGSSSSSSQSSNLNTSGENSKSGEAQQT